jgi:hypothetical protein
MKPIVYIEHDEAWLFDGKTFVPCEFDEIKKHQAGSFIPLSNLQIGNFKFLSSLGTTERQIQTEIKMHDEGGLNSEKDYEIASCEHPLEFENSTIVEAFACSHDDLNGVFADLLKQTKVIDWIVPSFITYESYYKRQEAQAKTDLFFYLSDTDSYAVFFHNGKYIAHRQTAPISVLAKEIGVDSVRCNYMLSNYGLIEENYPADEKVFFDQLQSVISKQVEKIAHTINHKRGLFGIDGIDRIFIDFHGNNLDGIGTIFSAYGIEDIPIEALVCGHDANIDAHRFVKAMYIYLCANAEIDNPLNLSPYERQQEWYKRHSGKLIGVSAAALVLALIHPVYYYTQGIVLQEQISVLESDVKQMEETTKRLSQKMKGLQSEIKKDEEKLLAMRKEIKVYEMTLQSLPVLMHSRDIRQKMMYDAINILDRYKLSAVSIDQNGTHDMSIHVIADYSKRASIAKFMQRWMQTGYQEARTDEIYLDENIYESKIKVLR